VNTFQQEWQTGNSTTGFPFLDRSAESSLPKDFIVDLRLFLTGTQVVQAYLSGLSYDDSLDNYVLQFSELVGHSVVLSGTVSRLSGSDTRVGSKSSISSGPKVCLFTPGASWDNPTWGGVGSWSLSFLPTETELSSEVVNPGPSTFRRIFIDGQVPSEEEWPRGGTQKIVAGYNINFGNSKGRTVNSASGVVDIEAFGGAGEGYPPEVKVEVNYLTSIGGVKPSKNGNVTIDGFDCLRVSQPKSDIGPIPHTLQIVSDCLPCCGCSDYLNTSRAIGRRSAKLKDLCDTLQAILSSSALAYNIGVEEINKRRKPLVIVRNVRALGSSIAFSVQNMTDIPVFAYVAFRVSRTEYALGPAESDMSNIVAIGSSPFVGTLSDAIIAHKETLMDLPFDISERPLAGIPSTNFEDEDAYFLFCVGEKKNSVEFYPISPGTLVECRIVFPERAAAMALATGTSGSVAAALPEVSFSSIAVYGASKSFPCSADKHEVKVVENDDTPDEFEDCDRPFANDFKTVLVV
jgi:hypothetical protein